MDDALRQALQASRTLEQQLTQIAADGRLSAAERSRRVREALAGASERPLAQAWTEAGRPEPLGFRYNPAADHAEWFDAWLEVESVVLDGEDRGYTRAELEAMVLDNRQPFDLEFEAEDLGIIHRTNEARHTD